MKLEYCCRCAEATGRAGAADDSLYTETDGPFCEVCFTTDEPAPVLWVMTTPIGGRKFVIESESEAKRFAAMGDRSVVPFYSAPPEPYRNPADDASLKRSFAKMESGIVAELVDALLGVIRVADRATDEFDAARAAIAKATGGKP